MTTLADWQPDPNGVRREEACAQALRNLLEFTAERFAFDEACQCDYCSHVRYAQAALKSHGYGEPALRKRPRQGDYRFGGRGPS